MIVGNDVSEWQGQIDWATFKKNTNFVIIRTSFGLTYIDQWFGYNRTRARGLGIPFGYYHFAKPDIGNSPQAEADFFCKLIDGDPIREGEVICLDFEVDYADAVNWCKSWLDAVSNHFGGMKLFIYLDQSKVKKYDWSPVVNAGHKLWLASYNPDGVGEKGKWDKITLQQWTSSQKVTGISGNVDGDHFFGTIEEFKALGYKKQSTQPTPVPPPIPPTPTLPPVMDYKKLYDEEVLKTKELTKQVQDLTNKNTLLNTKISNAKQALI